MAGFLSVGCMVVADGRWCGLGSGADVRLVAKDTMRLPVRCVILQPSYIPWRGFFDLIRRADVFVFLDDVQYDTRGWRNRNRIKTREGVQWLTIPVRSRGAQIDGIPISAIEMADDRWPRKHLGSLTRAYGKAPHFQDYREWLERTYAAPDPLLADFTMRTTIEIAQMLGVTSTRFLRSSELRVDGRKDDRLIAILKEIGADSYLSGPSARDYVQDEKFEAASIRLEWMEYNYPEYPQLDAPFVPNLSILDLLFMTGPDASRYIWGTSVQRTDHP